MSIVQLPKAQTGIPEVDRHLALITDKLNPVLRTMALPGGFKWVEIPGTNGGPSTFALQYGGTSKVVLDSNGNFISGGRKAYASAGAAGLTTSITSASGWTTMVTATGYAPRDLTRIVKIHMTASGFVSAINAQVQFRVLMDGATVISPPISFFFNQASTHGQWAYNNAVVGGTIPAGTHSMALQVQIVTAAITFTQDGNDSASLIMEEAG